MRYLRRTVPLLLLALLALVISSCSFGGSDINQEDVDYLNQVVRVMTRKVKQYEADLKKCKKATHPAACSKKTTTSFSHQMLYMADAYDRVANRATTGVDCARAIEIVSGDIRSMAGDIVKGSITISDQKASSDEDAMFKACNLKEM
jgi:hypothetical protein